ADDTTNQLADEVSSGKTTKDAMGAVKEAFSRGPESVSKWWSGLRSGTRRGIKVGAVGVTALGLAGVFRSAFEEEHEPVPVSEDMEGYLAAQQSVSAINYLQQ